MFLHPLGLLALLGVPTVLALHLFRRRFRPRVVSALFLWGDEADVSIAGRRRDRLRRSPSLWLELAAALLLGLAFAGPTGCGSGRAEHLVCVLDASASMGAAGADGVSFAERARRAVRRRVAELPTGSRVTLVRSGRRPTLLAGPAAFPGEALGHLDAYAPGEGRHALGPSAALGLQLAGGGTVVVLTDHHEPDAFPPEVELVAVGEPLSNVAITHATRARDAAGEERVLVTLHSHDARPGAAPRSVELRLEARGTVLRRETLVLGAGERRHFSAVLPPDTPELVVALGDDALAADNRAYLAPQPVRTLRLASTLEPAELELLGLGRADDPTALARWTALVPHGVRADPESAHLVIERPGARQPRAPEAWTLSIEADPAGAGAAGAPLDLVGPFLFERAHPLLAGTSLAGVLWSVDPGRALPGTPLVSAGDLPLLTEQVPAEGRRYRLLLDPRRSTLQRSPDWPILLANLAELRRAELPGAQRANVAIGEAYRYRGERPALYTLRPLAGGAAREVRARRELVVDDWAQPGFYALEQEGRRLATVGVSFQDAEESDLSACGAGRRAAVGERAETLAAQGPLETLLVCLALAALLGDWLVLDRARRARAARGIRGVDEPGTGGR